MLQVMNVLDGVRGAVLTDSYGDLIEMAKFPYHKCCGLFNVNLSGKTVHDLMAEFQ